MFDRFQTLFFGKKNLARKGGTPKQFGVFFCYEVNEASSEVNEVTARVSNSVTGIYFAITGKLQLLTKSGY
jgi:hypothetical protein